LRHIFKRDAARLNLFLTHQAALVDYATPIVGDPMRAEDVVQEAFIRFVQLDRKAVDQPVAYLYRIVRNLALDWTRRRATEQRHGGAEPLWWMLPDTPRTPEQDMLHRRDLARIGAALDGLAPETRLAVEVHRLYPDRDRRAPERIRAHGPSHDPRCPRGDREPARTRAE
jgi:RNA polymerase sigma-70 factor (ECF subfamily)